MYSASDVRYLVVKGAGGAGLGDKLRTLISAVVFAQLSGRRLYVDWNDPAYGDGTRNYFHDLFRLEGVDVAWAQPLDGTVRPSAWQGKLHLSWDQLYAEFGQPSWNRNWAKETLSFDQGVLDWPEDVCVMWDFDQFGKLMRFLPRLYPDLCVTPHYEHLQAEVLKRHVKPAPAVLKQMEPYRLRLKEAGSCVGVHVRASTEHYQSRSAPPVGAYVKAVKTTLCKHKAAMIFLATDNRDVQDLFVATFGADRLLWTGKWLPAAGEAVHLSNDCPDRLQSARDALVDLLLLASTDYLVTMENSSFSMLARMFSAAPASNRTTLFWKAPLWQRVLWRLGWRSKKN